MFRDGSLPDGRPGGAGVVAGAGVRLIGKAGLRVLPVGALLDGREGFLRPFPPFFRVAFQRLPYRPLRGGNWIGVASGWARGVRVSQLGVSR